MSSAEANAFFDCNEADASVSTRCIVLTFKPLAIASSSCDQALSFLNLTTNSAFILICTLDQFVKAPQVLQKPQETPTQFPRHTADSFTTANYNWVLTLLFSGAPTGA